MIENSKPGAERLPRIVDAGPDRYPGGFQIRKGEIVVNKKGILYVLVFLVTQGLMGHAPGEAKQLASEARSVIYEIQDRGAALSGELSEFHGEFSGEVSGMIELEAIVLELKREGDIGEKYSDSPEKYDRVYAEYAKRISAIKDIFVDCYPGIQRSIRAFNKAVTRGKDRVVELRSDYLAMANAEPGWSRGALRKFRRERDELEAECPMDAEYARGNCKRKWEIYARRLNRLESHLKRMRTMKKASKLKDALSGKLAVIIDQYAARETDAVDWMRGCAFIFEQYADSLGNRAPDIASNALRELKALEKRIGSFEKFHEEIGSRIADMRAMLDDHSDHSMEQNGVFEMESRGEALSAFDDREDEIKDMIKTLEPVK